MKGGFFAYRTDSSHPVLVHDFIVVPNLLVLRVIEIRSTYLRGGSGVAGGGRDRVVATDASGACGLCRGRRRDRVAMLGHGG